MQTTLEPDLVLLQRFRESRDPEAFREIVRRYTGAVFSTCHRILHDPGSAEDAAQETFFRLMTRPQRVTASLGGWLHRAATRLALDIRRSEVSRRRREIAYSAPEPAEAMDWADVAPKLDEALAALPEEQQDLLVRHFLRGEPQAELAAELQTSPATLSRRMRAAVDSLRQELAGRGLSLAPGLLFTLLAQNATSSAPAALKLAMGKMSLFCAARSAGGPVRVPRFSSRSFLHELPRGVYSVRWAFAAAAFSLIVAVLLGTGYRQAQSHYVMPASPATGVEARAAQR
jgi:RNA polymerase sigma-70 factor (ECF subfamily)